jgi:hypothetical protein
MRAMKQLALFAALLVGAVSCENSHSRLDEGQKSSEQPAVQQPLPPLPSNATVEQRVARLEEELARRKEALDFLEAAYAQNKQAMEMREAKEPSPDATFAVDIAPDLKAGQVEGPNTALVTIVEAWDFG